MLGQLQEIDKAYGEKEKEILLLEGELEKMVAKN